MRRSPASRRQLQKRMIWTLVGLIVSATLAIYFLAFTVPESAGDERLGLDFRVYLEAGRDIVNGENPYHLNGELPYFYPPLTAQTFALFESGSDTTLFRGWIVGNLLLLVITALAMATMTQKTRLRMVIIAGTILFPPLLVTLQLGQVTIILLALYVAAWIAYERDYPVWCGVLLAIAAWIKVYPALIIALLMLQREWRIVTGVAIGGLVLLLVQVLGAFDLIVYYFTEALPNLTMFEASTLDNNSLRGFLLRVGIANAQTWWIVLALPILGLTALMALRGRNAFAIGFPAALLLSSVTWMSNLLPVLLPLAILLLNPRRGPRLTTSLFLIYAFICMGFFASWAGMTPASPFTLATFGGLVLMWITALVTPLPQRSAAQPSDKPISADSAPSPQPA